MSSDFDPFTNKTLCCFVLPQQEASWGCGQAGINRHSLAFQKLVGKQPLPDQLCSWNASVPSIPQAPNSCADVRFAFVFPSLLTGCKYNQVNSHFHCIREGCQFSFLLKHQMTSHARKHMRRMLGKNFDRVPTQVTSHGDKSSLLSIPCWYPTGTIFNLMWYPWQPVF